MILERLGLVGRESALDVFTEKLYALLAMLNRCRQNRPLIRTWPIL
jgi:hypothetical protein